MHNLLCAPFGPWEHPPCKVVLLPRHIPGPAEARLEGAVKEERSGQEEAPALRGEPRSDRMLFSCMLDIVQERVGRKSPASTG